jgi:DNA-binding CsgD family transcriptional regulator
VAGAVGDAGVVVGVDGAGRTRRLDELAEAARVAGRAVVRVSPPGELPDFVGADLVLVDDPHRLTDDQIRALTVAARAGLAMVLARRPTVHSAPMADLDEAVAAQGPVVPLAPLTVAGVAALTGRDTAIGLHAASGGLLAVLVNLGPDGRPGPGLVARVQRRLTVEPQAAGLARLLALRLELTDTVLRGASELDDRGYLAALRALHDAGLLVPGTETMIPAVAEAIVGDLAAAQRRLTHEAVARALIAHSADVVAAATQLRAARAYFPSVAGTYTAAGDRLRFTDPAAALDWYADAVEAGAEPAAVATGRAEAAALLGSPVEAGAPGGLVEGAVAAQHGRAERSTEALLAAGGPGPLLAVPALVSIGRTEQARAAAGGDGPVPVRLLATAALAAAADPAGSVPLFIEAAEACERTPPGLVWPDTPHALGALTASLAGDVASAERLLTRALAQQVGGPAAAGRHRLLLAWVRLRAGRYDTAVIEATLPVSTGRDRLLRAALQAGIARRSGDVARLRDAWTEVEPTLARRAVDVSMVEAVEELAVAAARLRRTVRVEPVLDLLDAMVGQLGQAWQVAAGWVRLQVAIAEEDADAAAAVARRMTGVCAGVPPRRQAAQCAAAALWSRVLAGDVDAEAASAVGNQLAAVELPWEGSRLVGQAAIRTTDASAARRLLEHARELSSSEVVPAEGRAESGYGGLSEREVEVARMVLDGGTHREIGGRLFISPKTVEHHVARIRTKLGATNRAEFVAALRTVLGAP